MTSDFPHPGEFLISTMRSRGLSSEQLAADALVPTATLVAVLAGDAPLTDQLASSIGQALGMPPSLLRRFQAAYDREHAADPPPAGATATGPPLRSVVEHPHVGAYLREELLARGCPPSWLAAALDEPESFVADLLAGRERVTASLCARLGDVLGVSPELFSNLQAAHDRSRGSGCDHPPGRGWCDNCGPNCSEPGCSRPAGPRQTHCRRHRPAREQAPLREMLAAALAPIVGALVGTHPDDYLPEAQRRVARALTEGRAAAFVDVGALTAVGAIPRADALALRDAAFELSRALERRSDTGLREAVERLLHYDRLMREGGRWREPGP